jgi:hypothetical protein
MSDRCGTTAEGGWHCAGTGCLSGICLHDAAVPGVGLPEPVVVSKEALAGNHAGYWPILRVRRG